MKRNKEDIPVCWTRWSCWRKTIGDWWRSGREKCVPWSPICPQFWCSGKIKNWVRSESVRTIGQRSHFWDWASVWRRQWKQGDVCGHRDESAESEYFTFADALLRTNLLTKTVLEVVVSSSELPLCETLVCIFVGFFSEHNIVAIHIFQKLVHSARSNMRMASWGYCALVFNSPGESLAHPTEAFVCVSCGYWSESEVVRATSWDEVPSFVQSPPMGCASSL